MQLALLQFYTILSNFAVSLVSGFIPLIIYKGTQSILLAVLFVVIMSAVRAIFVIVLRRPMSAKPQVLLLFRLLPIVGYSIALVYISTNFWLNLSIIIVCYALQVTLKNGCADSVFTYATRGNSNTTNVTWYRIVGNISEVLSALLGGIFLNLNSTALILISAGIYTLSVVPLVIFYVINKRDKGFNKDYTTNAQLAVDSANDIKHSSRKYKLLANSMISMTFVTTTLIAVGDYVITLFNLNLFIIGGSFATAGYFLAVKIAAQILGNYLAKLLSKKLDNGIIAAIGSGLLAIITPFIFIAQSNVVLCILIILFGFCIEMVAYMCFINLFKGNIVGLSGEMRLYGRQLGLCTGQAITCIPAVIWGSIPLCIYILPVYFVAAAIYWPIKEERVRKRMVDYLMQNEI